MSISGVPGTGCVVLVPHWFVFLESIRSHLPQTSQYSKRTIYRVIDSHVHL